MNASVRLPSRRVPPASPPPSSSWVKRE
jgi:hypothetical protein